MFDSTKRVFVQHYLERRQGGNRTSLGQVPVSPMRRSMMPER